MRFMIGEVLKLCASSQRYGNQLLGIYDKHMPRLVLYLAGNHPPWSVLMPNTQPSCRSLPDLLEICRLYTEAVRLLGTGHFTREYLPKVVVASLPLLPRPDGYDEIVRHRTLVDIDEYSRVDKL